jgi:hypothetical protein
VITKLAAVAFIIVAATALTVVATASPAASKHVSRSPR